jgi:SpoVK/Ycf46/Vps4 family AAA+-type ATPase
MRRIAALAGGLVLRVSNQNVEDCGDIGKVLRVLHPSAILMDDLDRTEHPGNILGVIEDMRSCSLVLCSVNDLTKLDPAVLRAGRFDEIIEITKLDEGVLVGLLGTDLPPEISDRLRALPVAYIHEFHRRRDVLGVEQAIREVEELVSRTELVRRLCAGGSGDPLGTV